MGNGSGGATPGGGATDIRLTSGAWNNSLSLNSRIMVAAGSGAKGANAGGLVGYDGAATGGSQKIGGTGRSFTNGTFGAAGNGWGGGGGYYGGGGASSASGGISGGGSSYISGHTGSIAIANGELTNEPRTSKSGTDGTICTETIGTPTNYVGTTDNLCSIHYSNKAFFDTKMIDGSGYAWTNVMGEQEQMPNPNGGLYTLGVGHTGNGVAKITYISSVNENSCVSDNLIVHYDGINNSGNGNNNTATIWKDLSGNNNNGTLTGGTWQTDNLLLDGVDDYVTIPYNSSLAPSEYTIELLLNKLSVVNNNRSIIFVKWQGYTIELRADGTMVFGVNSNTSYIPSTTIMALNTIYKITATYKDGIQKLYINGELENTLSGVNLNHTLSNVSIGVWNNSSRFNGKIYAIKMYSTELNASQILQNYQIDKARFNIE